MPEILCRPACFGAAAAVADVAAELWKFSLEVIVRAQFTAQNNFARAGYLSRSNISLTRQPVWRRLAVKRANHNLDE